jgi:hypothetical protein
VVARLIAVAPAAPPAAAAKASCRIRRCRASRPPPTGTGRGWQEVRPMVIHGSF